jgi:hypothetical protein
MEMLLEGSCHCGAVKFSVESNTPYPYMRCYCSICRKTAGGGGYAINLMGWWKTMKIEGKDNLGVYRARMSGGGKSTGRRHFCRHCGSALWLYDPTWPDLVHPHASAIDTPLPVPPERVHIMLDSKASWVQIPKGRKEVRFSEYPEDSIEGWHDRHGLRVE